MALKEFDLEGKVALVTGAGRGVGKGVALALAEAGAHIVAAARTREEIEDTAKEVRLLGREALALPTDVTRAEEVQALVEKALAHFGKIDILVNNAGIVIIKPLVPLPGYIPYRVEDLPNFFAPISDEEWQQMLNTNLTGYFLCCRAVGPHMLERRKGKVINISSMLSNKADWMQIMYCTSKAAINMFTKTLALEWGGYGINVNALAPGNVHTAMSDRAYRDEKLRKGVLRTIPMGRPAETREIGLLAVFLASEASDYMTGQTFYLDGGFLAQG